MPAGKLWLETLTIAKLHRLAIAIGAPCSGTKSARVDGIRRAVTNVASNDGSGSSNLSLLSIDMGIRNLAFAHITAPLQVTNSARYFQYGTPTLQAWRRLAVSESPDVARAVPVSVHLDSAREASATKESFEPVDYATHAYNLINYMLQTYRPDHVLIERQRFRSGGGSAVQEWTIRVGVFEGMLYAALRTLIEERKMHLTVEPMQPSRVNRYWLEDRMPPSTRKLAGREVKRAKIELVGDMLREANRNICVGKGMQPFVADFVCGCNKVSKRKPTANAGITKLDDLADSLLQGLSWIE
jgi:cruciform cutting endonuclease 1